MPTPSTPTQIQQQQLCAALIEFLRQGEDQLRIHPSEFGDFDDCLAEVYDRADALQIPSPVEISRDDFTEELTLTEPKTRVRRHFPLRYFQPAPAGGVGAVISPAPKRTAIRAGKMRLGPLELM